MDLGLDLSQSDTVWAKVLSAASLVTVLAVHSMSRMTKQTGEVITVYRKGKK